MRTKDFKEWLRGMENKGKAAKTGERGYKAAGDR